MKRHSARDAVHRFLDIEATVGDNDEEDEEDNDGASAHLPPDPGYSLQLH
jgi:hypothetical protein